MHSKGDKQRLQNALSGSQVLCRPGWPLGNQSHSWHFKAAAKPLGNTLTNVPRFVQKCEMPRQLTGHFQSDSSRVTKSGGFPGSLLPRREWAWGALPLCSDHTENRRAVDVYKRPLPHRHWAAQFCRLLPTRVCTHAAPKVCEAPGHSLTLLVQSPQEAAAKHWPSWSEPELQT